MSGKPIDHRRKRKKSKDISLWLLFPLLPIILGIVIPVVSGIAILVGLLEVWRLALRERRVFRELRAVGRTLKWREVARHLAAGEGTLIIEQVNKQSPRFWWTPEDVAAVCPMPIPVLNDCDYMGLSPPPPFTSWCHARYLDRMDGSAKLTRYRGPSLPPGWTKRDFFLPNFPKVRVVNTRLVP